VIFNVGWFLFYEEKMKQKTKNIISIVLPMLTIFAIAFAIRAGPTGLSVYEEKYRINGSITITLEEKIPLNARISIAMDDEVKEIGIVRFLELSGREYRAEDDFIEGEGIYKVSLESLGIDSLYEKGKHTIETKVIYEDEILYGDKKEIQI